MTAAPMSTGSRLDRCHAHQSSAMTQTKAELAEGARRAARAARKSERSRGGAAPDKPATDISSRRWAACDC